MRWRDLPGLGSLDGDDLEAMEAPAPGEPLNSQQAGRTNQRARLLVLMAAIMLVGVIGQSVLLRSFLQGAFSDIEQGQLQATRHGLVARR